MCAVIFNSTIEIMTAILISRNFHFSCECPVDVNQNGKGVSSVTYSLK